MNDIEKCPAGYSALLNAVSNVARRLQTEGTVLKRFGRIPILVHDLEYCQYIEEATRNANPGGEADDFLRYLQAIFAENDGDDFISITDHDILSVDPD